MPSKPSLLSSDPFEGFLNVLQRVSQNYGPSMRARHRAVGFGEFVGNFGEDCLLCGREFKDQRHEQTLAFDPLRRALLQHSLEEHALMSYVLVYDPEPLMIHCQDERLANLPERLQ